MVDTPTYLLEIPAELKGKKIEILAFEIENNDKENTLPTETKRFFERTKHLTFKPNGYRFNRNEANDYA